MTLPLPQRARQRAAAFILTVGVLMTGCAGQAQLDSGVVETLVPVQNLNDVPFHPQTKYQCGPASLAMVLNHRGIAASPTELRRSVYIPGRNGSLQMEMVAAARQHDVLVYPLEPRLDALLKEIDGGNPVLVLQNLRFDWWPMWHFAVAVGYDLPERELILHSGTEARLRVPFGGFLNTWDRADRWARVMVPPHQLPVTAEPLTYIRAAHDLEQTGRVDAARAAYAAAQATWPENTAAAFAGANLALSMGNYSGAVAGFRDLLKRQPRYAPAWQNLGVALGQLECPAAARAAHGCAEALNDNSASPVVSAGADEASQQHCRIPACPIAD